jgi:hypothetical protein
VYYVGGYLQNRYGTDCSCCSDILTNKALSATSLAVPLSNQYFKIPYQKKSPVIHKKMHNVEALKYRNSTSPVCVGG